MVSADVRTPRLQVFINSTLVSGVYQAEVQSDAYLGADRFSLSLALDYVDTTLLQSPPLEVEIGIGVGSSWLSLIRGYADNSTINPIRRTAQLSGRDLSASLIASQTRETFENLTASDVAILLAQRHGLEPRVTPTADFAGRFYQSGHTRTALSQHGQATTEWDILTRLAQQEACDTWVQGRSLYFEPFAMGSPAGVVRPADCLTMTLSRDLTLAAGFVFEVQSWNSASRQVVQGRATYGAPQQNTPSIISLKPNLSLVDAQILASRMAVQLGSHERRISYEMPGDITTLPRGVITLQESGSDFDGTYVIYEVERYFSIEQGYIQRVDARQASWTTS